MAPHTPADVAKHWCVTDDFTLPWAATSLHGWGSAFCFACGWIVPPVTVHPRRGELTRRWVDWAERWLDVVALSKAAKAVSGHVVLCHRCADDAPAFTEKNAALAWVHERAAAPEAWQMLTDARFAGLDPEVIDRDTTLAVAWLDYQGTSADELGADPLAHAVGAAL